MSETSKTKIKSQICNWLQTVFGMEFNVEIEGNTEKGDGYTGDVLFVKAHKDEIVKYLVMKCAKTNEILREKVPIRDIFRNEIYVYETILPAFKSFELERGVANPFNKFPKFYGGLVTDSMEVVILENLRKRNFSLHEFTLPLSKNYIELVLEAYGHLHAVSVSMRDQKPDQFQKLTQNILPVWYSFTKASNFAKMFQESLRPTYELLKDQISERAMNEWKQFVEHIEDTIDIVGKTDRFTVFVHGDCWNNNFLFKGIPDPEDVAILDWQISSLSTPVIDISYSLFSTLAIDDLKNIQNYLKIYYESFMHHVQQLGSDLEKLYAFTQFEIDFKKFSRFGIMLGALARTVSMIDKEERNDFDDIISQGGEISDVFKTKIKNEQEYVARMKAYVEYIVDNGLIKSDSC